MKNTPLDKDFYIVGTVSETATLKQALVDDSFLNGCDMVELRLDETMDIQEAYELCEALKEKTRILLTIRTIHEGGTWTISEEDRYELFNRFAPVVDFYDLELASELFATKARSDFSADVKVITSNHDYEKTPNDDEISALIAKGKAWGVDIVKLAFFANEESDVERLESFLTDENSPLCLIAMSEVGAVTRKEFPKKGSVLTYGYLDQSVAPGQFSCKELAEYLR